MLTRSGVTPVPSKMSRRGEAAVGRLSLSVAPMRMHSPERSPAQNAGVGGEVRDRRRQADGGSVGIA